MQTNFETGWKKFWIFICWFRSHSKYLCYGTLLDFHPMNPDSRALHRRQTKYVCRNRRHGIGTYDHHTELDPVVAIYLMEFQNKEKKKEREKKPMKIKLWIHLSLLIHWTILKWIYEMWLIWIQSLFFSLFW